MVLLIYIWLGFFLFFFFFVINSAVLFSSKKIFVLYTQNSSNSILYVYIAKVSDFSNLIIFPSVRHYFIQIHYL